MESRRLGNSGLSISELTYGNWITHGSQIEDEQAMACVRAAREHGITSFDTADVYGQGRAEEVLGKALTTERRESIEIFTKVCIRTGPGPNDRGLGRKHIMEACHTSLKRLQTGYLDVYQAHRFDETTPLEETMQTFADLVRQGKILYLGVSEWTAEQISRGAQLARELGVPLVSNQPQYSMLWRVIESQVVPTCAREGIGQIVWSPLAQGVLSGKYQPGQAPPGASRATHEARGQAMIARWMRDDVLQAVQKLVPIAADVGLSPAQLALAWVLQNPNVSAAIIGASRPEQIADNVAASGVTLEQDTMEAIHAALHEVVTSDPRHTALA